MALQASYSVPAATNGVTATLAATTSSSAITLGKGVKFVIGADQIITITFGLSTGAVASTPSASVGFAIPAGARISFDLGNSLDQFKIFNTSASTTTYSYLQISQF